MEHPPHELEARRQEVEALANHRLEFPEHYQIDMVRRVDLLDGFHMIVQSKISALPDHETDITIEETEHEVSVSNVGPGAKDSPFFSCCITSEPEFSIHVACMGDITQIPCATTNDSLPDNLLLGAALAFVHRIVNTYGDDSEQSEAQELYPEDSDAELQRMKELISGVNQCLAEGTHGIWRSVMNHESAENECVIESWTMDGPTDRISDYFDPQDPLLVRVIIDGLAYEYVRIKNDRYTTRVTLGDKTDNSDYLSPAVDPLNEAEAVMGMQLTMEYLDRILEALRADGWGKPVTHA